MPLARVLAPAKINVWLHVLGPRPDGYHDLDTMFQALELADVVTVRVPDRPVRSLDVTGPMLPPEGLGPEHRNLAWRAAEEFRARAGWPAGFEISIVKNIPVGGGLGGGSSDAGAVLRALQAMAPAPLGADELARAAAALGSDVPFFVSGLAAAHGSGRGETLRPPPLSGAAQADVLLALPGFAIPTADAYSWLRTAAAYADPASGHASSFGSGAGSFGWRLLDHGNTFEQVVEPRFPVIRRCRERLRDAGATVARMSGSGSTVFGLFERGAPLPQNLGLDVVVIATRTAGDVVRVEVQQ